MRIVVVENEVLVQENLMGLIKKLDAQHELVGTADNGVRGLEVIRETVPDLVISDVQMPGMDGLTMLAKMRKEGFDCKAIVLTALSDFAYAKIAIEVGIEHYLLKPVKVQELQRALELVEQKIAKERGREQFFSLENVFFQSIASPFGADAQMEKAIEKQFGITKHEDMILFFVEIGEKYHAYHKEVKKLLKEMSGRNGTFSSYMTEFEEKNVVLMLLYRVEDKKMLFEQFQTAVVPMICAQVPGGVACAWGECRGLASLNETVIKLREELSWNLTFGEGVLVSESRIARTQTFPIKYPIEIENQAKQAIAQSNSEELSACGKRLKEYCCSRTYHPKEIKETCLRYCMVVFYVAKEAGKIFAETGVQDIINQIGQAISWNEIRAAFGQFFENLNFQKEETSRSLLVQRAGLLIKEYYNQGITLEEIARKLCVSDEYLSTQFKKETGKTFSETIRGYRIEKVKELLLNSQLKLNQIADMAGYADPKYMSKVFKEEVGVAPAEYRKLNN